MGALALALAALVGCGGDGLSADADPNGSPDSGRLGSTPTGDRELEGPHGAGTDVTPAGGTQSGRPPSTGMTGRLYFQSPTESAELDVATGALRAIRSRGLTDVSLDGRELLYSRYSDEDGEYELAIGDRSGAIAQADLTGDTYLKEARFSPDGRIIAALENPYRETALVTMTRESDWTPVAQGVTSFAFMPDGRLIYTAKDSIYLLALRGDRPTLFIRFPGETPMRVAPSPDGRRIAVVLGDFDVLANHVWVFDVGPGDRAETARQLTTSTLNEDDPAWSPDGRFIVVRHGVNYTRGVVPAPRGSCPTLYVVPSTARAPVSVGLGGDAVALRSRDESGVTPAEACAFSRPHWR